MSAFIVDKATIDAIVTIYIALADKADGPALVLRDAILEGRTSAATRLLDEHPDLRAQYDTRGKMLWEENYLSVNARYAESDKCPAYTFEPIRIAVALADALPRALGALHCYEYQSCEHERWRLSDAHAFVARLRARIERIVPKKPSRYTTPPYEMRPVRVGWDITDCQRDKVFTAEGVQAARAAS